jgi:molybdate transport repressor ModE-like protein
MRPKIKAWVVFPGGTKFGEGRAELLRLVDEEGSLKRAVERMEMSYRAAWGYLRELEAAAGFAFLAPAVSAPTSGSRLTPEGRAFLDEFERFRERIDAVAADAFKASFASSTRRLGGRASTARGRPARGVRTTRKKR